LQELAQGEFHKTVRCRVVGVEFPFLLDFLRQMARAGRRPISTMAQRITQEKIRHGGAEGRPLRFGSQAAVRVAANLLQRILQLPGTHGCG
jgi:hypothetical protein